MSRNSAPRKPGMSDMAESSRGPMMSTSRSVSAVTVALRGPGSMAASSPKKSPGPRVLTRRPICVTATEPERIRKNSRPIRPSRARTSPSPTCTPSARRATSSSCVWVQFRSRSTPCSRSTVACVPIVATTFRLPFRCDAVAPRLHRPRCRPLCTPMLTASLQGCCRWSLGSGPHFGSRPGRGVYHVGPVPDQGVCLVLWAPGTDTPG